MRTDALSPWLVALGLLARATGRRGLAGALWLTSGIGYFGIVWERATGASLRGLRRTRLADLDRVQLLVHILLAGQGFRWVSMSSPTALPARAIRNVTVRTAADGASAATVSWCSTSTNPPDASLVSDA